MPIVYRMRGLLGDATEDMVNSLDTGSGQCLVKCCVTLRQYYLCVNNFATVRSLVLIRM